MTAGAGSGREGEPFMRASGWHRLLRGLELPLLSLHTPVILYYSLRQKITFV